jgi:hypothetical protein
MLSPLAAAPILDGTVGLASRVGPGCQVLDSNRNPCHHFLNGRPSIVLHTHPIQSSLFFTCCTYCKILLSCYPGLLDIRSAVLVDIRYPPLILDPHVFYTVVNRS